MSDVALKSSTTLEINETTTACPDSAPGPARRGDRELLEEYASTRRDEVFAELVNRHGSWVYSSALRQVGNPAAAKDIAQAVFIILARKAATLRRETVLSGWLFRAVRFAAADVLRSESRRLKREQEAAATQLNDSTDASGAAWQQMAPSLDEALARLGAKDRHAVLLRFFEKKSFGEIGLVLGGNENSSRVRVVRALEKLRGFFHRRGVVISAVALSGALLSHAVQAAPPALVSSLAAYATAAGCVEAVLQRLLWRRLLRLGAAVMVLLFLIGGTTLAFRRRQAVQAAELAEAARSVRNLMIAMETAYTANDTNGFVALIHFRDAQEEQLGPVLADYVTAQSLFRQEMQRAFNVRRRTFDITFHELMWQQPEPSYIRSDRVSTNIMVARYPVRFVKAGDTWKWDLLEGLSPEMRRQRAAVLRHKTAVLNKLTGQIREGAVTNVVEILETVQSAKP